MQRKYVEGWLSADTTKIISLFTTDARIQPSSICPIGGIQNIRKFWFPEDGSRTIIEKFDHELFSIEIQDTLAYSMQRNDFTWTYQKDSTLIRRAQTGITLAVYKKQSNGNWKIWRQVWTDIENLPLSID